MFLLNNEADTARLAQAIAKHLQPMDCLTLTGNIGAGKTTLMRHVIGALQDQKNQESGIRNQENPCRQLPTEQGGSPLQKDQVISPSFMIVQEYEVGMNQESRIKNQESERGQQAEPFSRAGSASGSMREPVGSQREQLKRSKLYHIDGYRLRDESEIPELGLEEMLESGIVAIEWPELFVRYLPKNRLELTLELVDNGARKATLRGRGTTHENIATQISQEFHGNT